MAFFGGELHLTSCPTLRSNAAIVASLSATTKAVACSSLSSNDRIGNQSSNEICRRAVLPLRFNFRAIARRIGSYDKVLTHPHYGGVRTPPIHVARPKYNPPAQCTYLLQGPKQRLTEAQVEELFLRQFL